MLGGKIVEPYSVRRELLLPIVLGGKILCQLLHCNDSVCEMDVLLCRSCFDIQTNMQFVGVQPAGRRVVLRGPRSHL